VSYPVLSGAVVVTTANRRLRFREAAGAVGNVDLAVGTYYLRGRYSTNLMLRSEELDNASWTKVQTIIVPNAIIAPDGITTVELCIPSTTVSTHYLTGASFSVVSGVTYTSSVYAKAGGRSTFALTCLANLPVAFFDLQAKTATGSLGSTVSIVDVGNGWFRCSATRTAPASSADSAWLLIGSNLSAYAGDGVTGVYFWGAQVEAASTAGPYVRTTTASATGPSNELALAIKTGLDAFGVGGNTYDVSLAADIDPAKQASTLTITRTAGTDTFGLVKDGSQTFDYDLLGFSASTENDSAPKSGARSAAAVWVGNDVLREREPFGERTVAVPRKANGGVVGVSRSAHMVSWSLGFAFVHEARMLLRASVDPGGSLESFLRRFGAGAAFQAREVDVSSGTTLAPIIEHPFGTLHWSEDTLSAFRPRRIGPGVPLYDLDTTAHEQVT
jgi:hypothetical protein